MKLAKPPLHLQHALKEWAIAIEALNQGDTIILLRKGGIREQGFQVEHSFVWLYPTYEHQKPYLLKPEFASKVVPVESGWHPEQITIGSCAEITNVLAIDNIKQIEALQPYHIWNEQMIGDRLKWQPQKPLIVLLLKVYRLPQPQSIPYSNAYGGCKSWIELNLPIASDRLIPVIEDNQYNQKVIEIKTLLES